MRLALALAVCLVPAAACAIESGETLEAVELENSADEGKGDSFVGKQLSPQITSTLTVPFDRSREGSVDVDVHGDVIEIVGPRLVVVAGIDRSVTFRVDTSSSLDVFTDLKFLVYVRETGQSSWTPFSVLGSDGTKSIVLNYFDHIALSPRAGLVGFNTPEGGFAEGSFTGYAGKSLEYSFIVFPASGFGSLAGSYGFEFSATTW